MKIIEIIHIGIGLILASIALTLMNREPLHLGLSLMSGVTCGSGIACFIEVVFRFATNEGEKKNGV